MYRRKRRK